MSEPKRYIFRIRECGCVKPEHLEGKYAPSALIIEEIEGRCGWVSYEDYDRLKAEVEQGRKISGEGMSVTLDLNNQLLAENARLKAEVERLKSNDSIIVEAQVSAGKSVVHYLAEIERLKAEVERLTKAGDRLHKSMLEIGCNEMADNFQHDAWYGSMKGWHAAKEGIQP